MNTDKKLFILDAYALIYRSYFAFIKNPRFNSKGLNTSAMLGFTNTLEQVLNQQNPSHIAIAFDVHGPTFRHKVYDQYKANREAMPEDLRKSVPYIRDIIKAYNIPIIEKAGFEADDVVGTLSKMAYEKGYDTYMMTPDKDYAQLVNEKIQMFKPKRMGNESEVLGIDEVKEKFGVEDPLQVIDILGLMGDASDNIPGCPGIGPKTATTLISKYGSIEGIYDNIDQLKGKQKEKLIENKEQVLLSKELATIIRDVPLEVDIDTLDRKEIIIEDLVKLFRELEFKTLEQRFLQKYSKEFVVSKSNVSLDGKDMVQGDLFSMSEEEETEENISTDRYNFDGIVKGTIETEKHLYLLADTPELRADLRADLCLQKEFCFDTETTGLDPHTAQLVGISFSFKKGNAFYVPIPEDEQEAIDIVREFVHIFEDENILKIGQNIKYDILMLERYGTKIKGNLFDTMIAHYLLQPELKHNLDYLCELFLNYEKIPTENLIGPKGKKQKSMRDIPVEEVQIYACEDADFTYRLKSILEEEISINKFNHLFYEIEMPLVKVLVHMEQSGARIDSDALNKFAVSLNEQINTIEKEIIELSGGEEFNVASPKQLGIVLFDKLKIDSKAKKTASGQYSTSEDVLNKLSSKHPIINKVLEFRSLKKLNSTYVEVLPKLVNLQTDRIHTSFNQTVTSTGRLSSNNPNLQNIPIRDENGKAIRKAFIPFPGHLFLSADYSQVELRIMAALSQDKNMIDAFNDGIDIHTATASKIFHISINDVDEDMRRKAKTANFGIIYGISAFGLSQRLSISRSDAKKIIDEYFNSFDGIKKYMDQSIENARKNKFVETILGRKRFLYDIDSSNAVVRGIAERNAINAPIQGSAADIIKIAMIRILDQIETKKLKSKMILQVHDELNFSVPKDEIEIMQNIVKKEMENAVKLSVPLIVDMNYSDNWLDAH